MDDSGGMNMTAGRHAGRFTNWQVTTASHASLSPT
jgi:hypothetical protein